MRRRHRGALAVYRGLPCPSEPSGPARLAAAVVADALKLARTGDDVERRWITSPGRVEPWARSLGVSGERLADLARSALRHRAEGPEE